MPIIFSDEDLMYIGKEQDNQLRSIRQEIDTLKAKSDVSFCKKCGHIMQGFTVGNAKLLECGFCGNRIAEMMKTD
jgi:ribosomal protein L32